MSKVYLMVTITGRGQGEQFAALNLSLIHI